MRGNATGVKPVTQFLHVTVNGIVNSYPKASAGGRGAMAARGRSANPFGISFFFARGGRANRAELLPREPKRAPAFLD
jgi:hypothetical protein